MSLIRLVVSEIRKLLSLPAPWIGLAIMVFGCASLTAFNALNVRNALLAGTPGAVGYTYPVEAAMATVPLGTAGAIVIGVISMSSEYAQDENNATGSRQIVTTLTANPVRLKVLVAKLTAVSIFVVAGALIALPAAYAVANRIIGGLANDSSTDFSRFVGAGVYWLLISWTALGIAALGRSGTIPILVLVISTALGSVSFALLRFTHLGFFLPDVAGTALYARETWGFYHQMLDAYGLTGGSPNIMAPIIGGLIMAAWVIVLLIVAGFRFQRSDA